MIDALLRTAVKSLLAVRYRVRVSGVDAVRARGTRGILFLPNHPGLIDPIIVLAALHRDFRPRPLADEHYVAMPVIRGLARRIGVIPLPDLRREGALAKDAVAETVRRVAERLRAGDNVLLYPSGHIYRTRFEDLRGNSAVENILALAPATRIVLVRTRGLWGSRFGLAGTGGRMPGVGAVLRRGAPAILANLFVFTPKRHVTIDLFEPDDLPRAGGRNAINAYLERFYNEDAPPATYVPLTIWERGGRRELPEPEYGQVEGAIDAVPAATRELVLSYLRDKTGQSELGTDQRLAQDLGMDSLAKAELVLWLADEFGASAADVDALQTVGDVLLAARGQAVAAKIVELKPVPRAWFAPRPPGTAAIPAGLTVNEVFLAAARRAPDRVIVADQRSGARTARDLVAAIFVLRPLIEALPGQRIGIMLPASVAASVAYLATLFSGRTPVMINWTTGTRNVLHSLELCGVERVLTAGPLVARLQSQGIDPEPLKPYLLPLEQLVGGVSRVTKLLAAARARIDWSVLERARPPEHAVVLLTSGSESLPKAVPLTHVNVLANLRDLLGMFSVRNDDVLMGFLPPFHSFGLTITTLVPLLAGVRAVYHANPTEAALLARLIEAYRATMVAGTPTFLYGIARAATAEQLRSLRLIASGAEKCPEHVYAALGERCPQAPVLEGYGITECSPVVATNHEALCRPGTIGQVLPSLEYAIIDVERGERVTPRGTGMLLVRGPSIFEGYLGGEVASPFIEFEGKHWYRTGDLVSEDADRVLTFRGRLKRFVKLGGEMISLPAIEEVLSRHYSAPEDEGPVVAVEATPSEDHPEVVLFTTRDDVDRTAANRRLREAGLSALHNITRVVRVESIPLLGTGKTDYRALRGMLGGST
ncbi:MAG: AMP-binding protein [Phycisphaerales bacterium]|nr:AMP-binding protein [Phycisphaerales bacterium]